MNKAPSPPPDDLNEQPRKKPLLLPLLLAFTPSALFLLLLTISALLDLNSIPPELFVIGCIASIILCLVSSTMLFRRRKGGTVIFAVLLLLLNAFVSFAFGCGAILTQLKM